MKAATILTTIMLALPSAPCFGQAGTVIPQPSGSAGHAGKASCVILKRMGPADQVTSRLYSFGIRGKQFQYVEGKLPEGFPFHGRLTDHDVRNLQSRGAEVMVLNQNYTSDELKQARSDCQGETGKTPNQADEKAASTPVSTADPASVQASPASAAPAATPTGSSTAVDISSTPLGADIEIDGKFVGDTPSTVDLTPGDHEITIKKSSFVVWTRKITASGGHIHVNAELASGGK